MSNSVDNPPPWFTAALSAPVESGNVVVEDASIAYRAWGPVDGPGIVLVHGGAAHAGWWDHVAPLLVEQRRRVVALDLSGHGDSDHRDIYTLDTWAAEVMAVGRAAGIDAPPTVVGHSMGGYVTLWAAMLFGPELDGAIAIDSPVRDPTPEELAAREERAFGPPRVYPTAEQALSRFHPVPDQPVLDYVAAHVAAQSIRQVPATAHDSSGWTWKFDSRIFGRPQLTPALLTRLRCRVALFRGQHGILSHQLSETMYDRLGRVAPVIEIPDAGHHVMLDQPLALIAALRTLLADWEHTVPVRSPQE